MHTLNQMLDSAIVGNFTEQIYNETLISSFENKFYRYLSANEVSSHNLAKEKEHIKQLIADISHQTKTPIANILLYAQLLEEHELPAESFNAVTALRTQADKLNFLIETLIKLSRLETGVFKLHPALSPVSPMLEDVISAFAQKANQKKIEIRYLNSKKINTDNDVHALFDLKWTAEALGNIIDNAIKYTPIGGNISVSVIKYDLFCCINIKDSGIGISEEEQAKIFMRFYRSPSVYHQEGIGIGLYLTRHILSGQGGYIKVSSTLDEGTLFSLFLPSKV